MPDFQIVRLPDFRDISGAEAEVRVRVRAGVVAVEVEHASVRTVVPVAPAIHAALPFYRHIPHGPLLVRLFPAAEHAPDFVQFFAPDFMEPRRDQAILR